MPGRTDSSTARWWWRRARDRRVEIDADRLVDVELSGAPNQTHGESVIDAPVPLVQRIGQRRAGRRAREAHMKQLGMIGLQTNLDIAQRLALGQLREGYDAKQIGTVQGTQTRIASVAFDDSSKGLPWHVLHHLRKQRLANVHASLPVAPTRKHRKCAVKNSNRGHP